MQDWVEMRKKNARDNQRKRNKCKLEKQIIFLLYDVMRTDKNDIKVA